MRRSRDSASTPYPCVFPIARIPDMGCNPFSHSKMKQLSTILTLAFVTAAFAGDKSKLMSLEITVERGIVSGLVRNRSNAPVKANAEHLYGWWEFTHLSYFDGSWHEAPLAKEEHVRIGATREPVHVILEPGGLLVAPRREVLRVEQVPPPTNCTFRLQLADYQLPKDTGKVSKIRVETNGLTATLEIGNPNKALLGDEANRAREP
jgi:hypothetical protein